MTRKTSPHLPQEVLAAIRALEPLLPDPNTVSRELDDWLQTSTGRETLATDDHSLPTVVLVLGALAAIARRLPRGGASRLRSHQKRGEVDIDSAVLTVEFPLQKSRIELQLWRADNGYALLASVRAPSGRLLSISEAVATGVTGASRVLKNAASREDGHDWGIDIAAAA